MNTATSVQFSFFTLLLLSLFHFAMPSGVFCTAYCDMVCNCTQNFTYQCADGTCIPFLQYRDMHFDCPDNTDELVDCCPDQFKCDSSHGFAKCLPQTSLDNGITECMDGSDETANIERSCSELPIFRRYECYPAPGGIEKGLCISIPKILNGKFDCPLEDDEDPGNFDECTLNLHQCSPDATCVDVPMGAYNCTCKPGFVGDGHTCLEQQGTLLQNSDGAEPASELEDDSDTENNGNGPLTEEPLQTAELNENGFDKIMNSNQDESNNDNDIEVKQGEFQDNSKNSESNSNPNSDKNQVQSNLHKYTIGNQQLGHELANAAKNIKNSMHN